MALGQNFLRTRLVFSLGIIPTMLHTHLYLIINLGLRKTRRLQINDTVKFFRIPGTYKMFISAPMVMQDWEFQGGKNWYLNIHVGCVNKLVCFVLT